MEGLHGAMPSPQLQEELPSTQLHSGSSPLGGGAAAAQEPHSQPSGAGAATQQPVHLLFHREVTLDVPASQVQEAVQAIVQMQPLPIGPRHAPLAEPSGQPARHHQWRVVREVDWGEGSDAGSSPGGGSFVSAASVAGSASGSTSAGASSPIPAASQAEPLSGWEQLRPTVPPPPRPEADRAADKAAGTSQEAARSSMQSGTAPPAPQASPQEQGAAEMQPTGSQATSFTEGPLAPPSTPADIGSPRSSLPPGLAEGGSGPASPATPSLDPQARFRQQQDRPPDHASLSEGSASPGSPAMKAAPGQASPAGLPASGARSPQPISPSGHQLRQQARGTATATRQRSRLAMEASAASHAPPGGLQSPSQLPAAATTLPRAASAGSENEPQQTVIHGPWPPPPTSPPRQIASPRGTSHHRRRNSNLPSAFAGDHPGGQGAGWRQLDDGTWVSSAEVDWYGTEGHTAGAEGHGRVAYAGDSHDLMGCPLVEAASQSPPLSPITTQLLTMRHPSTDLRRGPQRAASFGLPKPERQPSLMSPERQHTPPMHLPATFAHLHPAPVPEIQPEIQPVAEESGAALAAASGGSSFSSEVGRGSPSPSPVLPHGVQVVNASPDVTPSSPAQPSLFQAAAGQAAGGSGAGFDSLGGLPVEILEKRERRPPSGDLSPREAYARDESAWRRSELRRPLLPMPPRTESEAEQGLPASLGGRSDLLSSTALMATPLLAVGLVVAPRVFALLGLVAGSISLAAVVLAAFLSLSILVNASSNGSGYLYTAKGSGYAGVVSGALGSAGALVADLAMAFNCFGLMVASLIVLGDILVGSGGSEGILGEWSGNRATVLAVVVLVLLAPLSSCRDLSLLAGGSAMALAASCMAAAAVLALTVVASTQHGLHRPRVWPDWASMGAGAAGWFHRATAVLAVVPVLLSAMLCHPSLHPIVQQMRPSTPTRALAAAGLALAYGTALLALLGVCGYLLFGSEVQPDLLLDLSTEALDALAGKPLGQAAFLLIHVALAVCLAVGFPLLMGPFRDAVWRVLFWQPLGGGSAGFYLVTLLAAAGALWASVALQTGALWQLLSVLGASSGALLALIAPGLVAIREGGTALACGGVMLVTSGAILAVAAAIGLVAA